MATKKNIFYIFLILIAAQLYIPAQMIYKNNSVVKKGKIYKFQSRPVDPYDPFRGKYINLNYTSNLVNTYKELPLNTDIYATLFENKNGFAAINYLSTQKPNHENYITVKITNQIKNNNSYKTYLEIPFNKFYMNEYKAPQAEITYRDLSSNLQHKVYALVAVYKGDAVIKNVFIDDVTIDKYQKK